MDYELDTETQQCTTNDMSVAKVALLASFGSVGLLAVVGLIGVCVYWQLRRPTEETYKDGSQDVVKEGA